MDVLESEDVHNGVSPSPSVEPEPEPTISITVTLGARTQTFQLPISGTLDDLTLACEDAFGADAHDWTTHKFIAPPPVGLLKGEHRESPLAPLAGKKVRLLAPRITEVNSLLAAEQAARRRRQAMRAAAQQRKRSRRPKNQGGVSSSPSRAASGGDGSSMYTFLSLRPLPYLPHPERSLAILERLRDDRGVREVMRRRKFTVGLLTEMDPAAHTDVSHEGVGRTLGLNRNRGEAIELRLRTDAGDGYRDYRTVRRTLCHELAHNVFGPHDRNFWELCHAIEREVAAADWAAGHTVSGVSPDVAAGAYDDYGDDEDGGGDVPDHGGWTGGEFVLGGAPATTTPLGGGRGGGAELTRREILAKAAEERLRRMNRDSRDGSDAGGGESGI